MIFGITYVFGQNTIGKNYALWQYLLVPLSVNVYAWFCFQSPNNGEKHPDPGLINYQQGDTKKAISFYQKDVEGKAQLHLGDKVEFNIVQVYTDKAIDMTFQIIYCFKFIEMKGVRLTYIILFFGKDTGRIFNWIYQVKKSKKD